MKPDIQDMIASVDKMIDQGCIIIDPRCAAIVREFYRSPRDMMTQRIATHMTSPEAIAKAISEMMESDNEMDNGTVEFVSTVPVKWNGKLITAYCYFTEDDVDMAREFEFLPWDDAEYIFEIVNV